MRPRISHSFNMQSPVERGGFLHKLSLHLFDQETLSQRNLGSVSNLISLVQSLEKTKLMLVAAQHLDIMNLSGESVQLNMGNLSLSTSRTNSNYSLDKINQIKIEISEHLENFQSMKCEFLET